MRPRYELPPDGRPDPADESGPDDSDRLSRPTPQPWADQLAPEQRSVPLTPDEANQHRDNPDSPFVALEYQPAGGDSRLMVEAGITPEHQRARYHALDLKIRLAEVELDRFDEQVDQQRRQVDQINQAWRAVRAELVELAGSERADGFGRFHRLRRQHRQASQQLAAAETEFDQAVDQLDQLYQTRDRYQDLDQPAAA